MRPLRVAILADLLEEQWPSMDLVADMLVEHLLREHGSTLAVTLIRPEMRRIMSRLPLAGSSWAARTADRFAARLWHYPRDARRAASSFDVFHVVDHSYGHLVHELPAARVLVTCHDLDTFRSILDPELEPRSAPFRAITRRILAGVTSAGHVACDSRATRDRLVARAGMEPGRTSVLHNGPHPGCSPVPEPAADAEAARMLGPASQSVDLLHVGSTIPRKRIDVLLRVFAGVRAARPGTRLVRVGGPLSGKQRTLARELGIDSAIVTLPFLDRNTLAAVYRRSALVLIPSEREGFGLPVLEALACGTPVLASDIEALREVGGEAVDYCPVGDVPAWVQAVEQRLVQRVAGARDYAARRAQRLLRAAAFSWSRYAAGCAALYRQLAGVEVAAP
jgi:glycosyltransferase involved in cell wall biosynthesis